jgi:hypothetical protein
VTKTDRAALKLAIKQCRAESPERAEQIDAKLADEPWEEVAEFAAYCCQTNNLRLKPWQTPPCHVGGDDVQPEAVRLLEQMRELGISRWHPDPLAAIEAAKQLKAACAAFRERVYCEDVAHCKSNGPRWK